MSMEFYRGMLTQKSRMNAFSSHIADVVRPGDLVLEVGAGLGTYSFFSVRAGAAKVWAIESGSVIEAAKSVAVMNGFDDRIEFLRGRFPTVGPPEPVDVAIFEDFPARLLGSETYRVITAIHRYALKPGGRLIPDRAKLFAAPVMAEESWEALRPLEGERDVAYGIDWSTTREYVLNKPLDLPLRAQDLRGPPGQIADVSFATPPDSRDLAGEAIWTFDDDTEINGFAYWFDVEVGTDVWLSNAPEADPGSWGCLYLPLPDVWSIPSGTELSLKIAPEVAPEGEPNWLVWTVLGGDRTFRGHEFKSFPANLGDMVENMPNWQPQLTAQAEMEQRVLELADGTRTLAQIVEDLVPEDVGESRDGWLQFCRVVLSGRTIQTGGRKSRRARSSPPG